MTSVRRVGHALVVLVVVLLVGVFVVQAFPQAVGADQSFVVLSGSMEPAISPGDVVIVSSVPASTVEANDVITYRQSSTGPPVTHRVQEVIETPDGITFVTKGDANEDADPGRVPGGNLIGRVMFTIPYAGHVVLFANTRLGRVLLVAGPLVLLALSEAASLVLGRRANDADDGGEPSPGESGPAMNAEAESPTEPVASEVVDGHIVDASNDDEIAVTTTDLRLSAFTFASFAAYAIWTAYQDPGGLTIGVAMATVCAVLLVALVYVAGEPEPEPTVHGQLTDGGTETAAPDTDPDAGDDE